MEKRKRGRPRKNPTLPEPIQKIIDSIEDKDRKEFQDIVEEERKKRKGNWDITKDDPISFFDRSLSYEISGYRPIDDKHGLDFNPDWFCEARNTFKRTGHYCQFPKGSKAFSDYWTQEYVRCRDGLTVNDYTITGDHYFFLNYYQLANLDTAKAGGGRHLLWRHQRQQQDKPLPAGIPEYLPGRISEALAG